MSAGFWASLKPPTRPTPPRKIAIEPGGRKLILEWEKGPVGIEAEKLRAACPCASCRDRPTPQKPIGAVAIVEAKPVGRYALSIAFDDGHRSGIYDWELLSKSGLT